MSTKSKKNHSIESIVTIGMFTAVIAIISALPIGFEILGVPATLQTFAMAFVGYALSYKLGTSVCAVYILLGLIGVPVYSKFQAGPGVLFGPAGGFLFGFLFLSFLCGFGLKLSKKSSTPVLKAVISLASGIVGLFICHAIGVIQFSIVYKMGIAKSFLAVSSLYLPKDIVSVIIAYFIAIAVRSALSKAKILPESARI